jgi:hypothetical protein
MMMMIMIGRDGRPKDSSPVTISLHETLVAFLEDILLLESSIMSHRTENRKVLRWTIEPEQGMGPRPWR